MGLILALMLIVCYLAVILIFWWLRGGYCSLLVVTARYRSLLLVPIFSMNINFLLHIMLSKF